MSYLRLDTLLWLTLIPVEGEEHLGLVVDSDKCMVSCLRLLTLLLLLVTSCGRRGVPRFGELLLRKVLFDKVTYSHLAFSYILWKERSTKVW